MTRDEVRRVLRLSDPERASTRRIGLWVGLGVIVLLGIAWLVGGRADRELAYATAPVEQGALELRVSAVGRLEPSHTVGISSELSGIVAAVYVDVNDVVEAGQPLAELDTAVLSARAREARANVLAAEAALAEVSVAKEAAERQLSRTEALGDTVSEAAHETACFERDRAAAGVALAEARLAQARATAHASQTQLSNAVIRSPIPGVVLERNVDVGEAVVSALQAQTLFRVAEDLRRMTVDVEIDEADVGRIAAGQPADFTVAAYPERVFDAVVDKVLLSPLPRREVVAYIATLTLDNADLALFPGMTASASIVTDVIEDAWLVPDAALRFTPEGVEDPDDGLRRVWQLGEDGLPQAIEVELRATDGRQAAVASDGLANGLSVVIPSREVPRG